MTLVHFPSNASTPRSVRSLGFTSKTEAVFARYVEEAERLYEREGALLQTCASLRDRVEQLDFAWNHIEPSEAEAKLTSLQEEVDRLPAASTQRVQAVASAIEEGISQLRFRQAFPIVAELDADSLIPNAADQLPAETVKRMGRTVAEAKQLFEKGDPRAAALMKALEKTVM